MGRRSMKSVQARSNGADELGTQCTRDMWGYYRTSEERYFLFGPSKWRFERYSSYILCCFTTLESNGSWDFEFLESDDRILCTTWIGMVRIWDATVCCSIYHTCPVEFYFRTRSEIFEVYPNVQSYCMIFSYFYRMYEDWVWNCVGDNSRTLQITMRHKDVDDAKYNTSYLCNKTFRWFCRYGGIALRLLCEVGSCTKVCK